MTTHTTPSTGAHTPTTPIWRTVNISRAEQAGRILIGMAAIIAGVVLLISARSALAVVLELLLVAAGLDMLVTGHSDTARSTKSWATYLSR